MTVSCWRTRHLDYGYESQTDAMLAYLDEHGYEALDALAREAGYDVSEAASRRDGGAYWLWEVMGDICLLDAGHAGPHEFSRTRDVVLTFKGEPGTTEGAD